MAGGGAATGAGGGAGTGAGGGAACGLPTRKLLKAEAEPAVGPASGSPAAAMGTACGPGGCMRVSGSCACCACACA